MNSTWSTFPFWIYLGWLHGSTSHPGCPKHWARGWATPYPLLASPRSQQYLYLDENSYELKWPFVTTQLLHTAAPWCKKFPYDCYILGPCSPLVSSSIHLHKSTGWKCQSAVRFPCWVPLSLCDLSTATTCWRGRLCTQIQIIKYRWCRLSIGSPYWKGVSLPWSTIHMHLGHPWTSQMPLDIVFKNRCQAPNKCALELGEQSSWAWPHQREKNRSPNSLDYTYYFMTWAPMPCS